jgi:Tfp pilus assembly protein PilN
VSVGILLKEKTGVVEIKENGNSIIVDKSYIAENGIDCKNAVVGLPLDSFIIKNLYLPNVSKKELQKTIELQLEFNIPNQLSEYDTSYIVKEYKAGYLLLILAAKKTEFNKKTKAIVPAPLGLYSFALQKNLIEKKENTLLLYIDESSVTSVTLEGTVPVFMREYPLGSLKKIKQWIQLSSQAVYLQIDRHFIDINKIVVLSADDKYKNLMIEAVGDKTDVQWVDSSTYDNKEFGNLLLHVGLALFNKQSKAMSGWSISKKPPGMRESIKRILIFIIPILIIFLPLYYFAGYYANSSKIESIQTEIKQFSAQLGDVTNIGSKVAKEEAYMTAIGDPSLNFARTNKLFNEINKCRSNDFWITSISGKVGGLIVINGYSLSYSDITSFIKNIEASEFISDINLNYSNEASAQNVSFQMTLHMAKGYSFILEDDSDKKTLKKKTKKATE